MHGVSVLALLVLEIVWIKCVESSKRKRVTINQQQGRLVFGHVASLL